MQLYNTLSAEERAIMIDDLETKTYFVFMLMRKSKTLQFRNDLFLAWNPLEVLAAFMSPMRESTPNCPFLLIISTLSRTVLKYMLS
jgi:uncharacterized protein YfaA (DUF2138 family)